MPSIHFQTHAFPTAPEGDLERNNGMPGSALAAWLRAVVQEAGFACDEPMQEDYGWGFWLRHDCMIWIAAGLVDGMADSLEAPESVPEWAVSVEHERPFFAPTQWFKKDRCSPIAEQVFSVVLGALSADPRFGMLDDA